MYIQSHVPPQFNMSALSYYQCSVAVITYGQWLASMQTGVPYTRTRYKKEMNALMLSLSSAKFNGPTKIFFRSENYNGLGYYYTRCPPIDYRTVPVIDMMNSVQRELTLLHNLSFIDMNHIMGSMWDSAADYRHPTGKVFDAEIEWIVYSVFDTYNKRGESINMYILNSATFPGYRTTSEYNATFAAEASSYMHATTVQHRGGPIHFM